MPDGSGEELRPATREEMVDSFAFALRFQGRKRVHHADDIMAHIAAERLADHLKQSGFVMKRPQPDPPIDLGVRARLKD